MAVKSRRRLWITLALVVLLGAFLAASLGRSGRGKGVEVKAEPVARERIESWIRAPGTVQPVTSVQISSNVTGRIEELAVTEGQRVARGDLLLRLDDERYRSALRCSQALVDAARADLELAEAQQDQAGQTLQRQERLSEESLVSQEALIDARTSARVAEARVAAAREELRRREASLAEARKDLAETIFYAPMGGIVTALNVEAGENVVTGTMNNPGTVILALADLDTMQVEAEVDETDVIQVRPGQESRILVDAMEDSTLAGRVTSVGMSGRRGSESQQQGRSFEVQVRILQPPPRLRPGMSADVDILTGAKDDALVIPIQALTAHPREVVDRWNKARKEGRPGGAGDSGDDGGSSGHGENEQTGAGAAGGNSPASGKSEDKGPDESDLVEGIFLARDGQAVFVPVTLGLRGDSMIEVAGEVGVGDMVITGPYRELRKLEDGAPVRVEETKNREESGEDGAAD